MSHRRHLSAAAILALAACPAGHAQSEADPPGPAAERIELPDMEVMGEKEELALRLIKSGLEADRSTRYEDRNRPYCWFDRRTGSHHIYLYCGLNRSLNAESRYWGNFFRGISGSAGTLRDRRNIYRSNFPVNRVEIERMMTMLGPSDLNDEIVTQALHGASLPGNIPDDAELDRFARALQAVRAIRERQASALDGGSGEEGDRIRARHEAAMTQAIRDAGLDVARYNEISDLVERFESLRERVTERLAGR